LIIPADQRADRRYSAGGDDQRSKFQRDRDRILYSSAFRRLAGITQIARAGEADVFHTRLAHTLKVAQVGRRLAEHVVKSQGPVAAEIGVEPEVVEAACLAHDLGHPPFGHMGEEVLCDLVTRKTEPDGYEGNAQSLRILTKLAVRFEDCDGLDLTRATLAACVKYPWRRDPHHHLRSRKWGYYSTEEDDFLFARANSNLTSKTAEAELMDWADDIAYSVHDLEDFHRCRLIPWRTVFSDEGREQLLQGVGDANERLRLSEAHLRLKDLIETLVGKLLDQPYEGTREQRRVIRFITSQLIGRYVTSIKVRVPAAMNDRCVEIDEEITAEVTLLKLITRKYILNRPALVAQQRGQSRILGELFKDLFEKGSEKYLPEKFRDLFANGASRARCVADCISSLTEKETVALHGRLRGYDSGSVLDPIVR